MTALTISPAEGIATINPYLHGHFAEHLGELVYPGVWVGPESAIPNTGGLRNDVLDALRPLEVPVLRWPGGCFADDYHWRDGVGPRAERPLRVNRHWGHAPEPNHFGTHEFVAFCQALGAEPYLAANVGSGTPAELRDWVEYCNFGGDSTLARERAAHGAPESFGIRLWGIGNENWGCGGHMSPEYYADLYFRYRGYVADYSGTQVQAIACGPNNADWEWTRRFLAHARSHYGNRLRHVQGFAAHFYCGTAGTATEFTDAQWLELLARAYALEGVITGTRALMDEHDPERRIPLLLDEWGTWHPVAPGKPKGGLYQQNTRRDACVAALTLDLLHRYADRVWMANIAQLINVLQALLLVDEASCVRTPTYHVFDLYRPHRGGQSVRCEAECDAVTDGGPSARWCRTRYLDAPDFRLPRLAGSASLAEGVLTVTGVNTHPSEPLDLALVLRGARWPAVVRCRRLEGPDLGAHNTAADPARVTLSPEETLPTLGGELRLAIAPGGIFRVRAHLE